jgi:MFS family permease
VAILSSVFPAQDRGRVLGLNSAAVYLGLSIGPLLGGLLTKTPYLEWRSIFIFNTLIDLVLIITILSTLKGEWAESRGEKFDFIGSFMYGLPLIALMLGFSELSDWSFVAIILIVIGIIGLGLFVVWELRLEHPVLDIKLFKSNRVFAFSNLATLINYSATFVVSLLISLYMQYIKGFSPFSAGLFLIAQPVMMVICSPISGRLSDRVNPGILASIGMIFTTIGIIMLAFLGNNTPLFYILLSLIILGCGYGFFTSPNTNAVMGSVNRKSYGVAASMLSTMRLVGQAFSLGIATLVFALVIGEVQITKPYYPAFLNSVHVIFTISAILCVFGIFASTVRVKRNSPDK